MENKADNLCGGHMWISAYTNFQHQSKSLGLSSPNEILSGRDSCMSCSMHKIRSCAHTLRRDQESGGQAGVELETWKKLFKGWTVSFESWGESARWTEERRMASRRCKRTGRHWY
jgi:hypothetical protein